MEHVHTISKRPSACRKVMTHAPTRVVIEIHPTHHLGRVVPYAQFPNETTEDPRRSSADIFLAAVAVDQLAAEAWKIENIYRG